MLDEREIERLCHGRIIKAPVYNSSGSDAAGPHYAVILDTDEEIKEHDSYYVAVISHNQEDKFIMPVPAHTGLDGFVQGSWTPLVHLAGITEIRQKLFPPEMMQVLQLVKAARTARAGKTAKKR